MRNTLETDYVVQREATVNCPLEMAFGFFTKAENLETLTPPWLRFQIETPQPIPMRQGATIAYRLRVHGVPLRWLTEIEVWRPPHEFVDVQVKGPYKIWRHIHRFEECGGGVRIVDIVRYSLPFGLLGRLAHRLWVAEDVAKIFDYREQRVRALLRLPGPK